MPQNHTYTIKNPLKREGTSQEQRQLPALDPNSVKIDERTIQDFLVYAKDFARQIYYYNKNNAIDGDWEDFFAFDISFIVASIEKTNPQTEKDAFIKIYDSKVSVYGLNLLFQHVLSLIRKIDQWYLNLPVENEFRDQISRLIRSNIEDLLSELYAYEAGAFLVFNEEGYPQPTSETYTSFSSIWNFEDVEAIPPDLTLFTPKFQSESQLPQNPTEEKKLETAYIRLNDKFTELYNIYIQVIRIASVNFQKSLELDNHEPHIALFFGFLFLYQKIQEDINKITGKHLDFYYKNVLGLKLKPVVADNVHLYFELAKHISEHKIKKGTRFLAGKDESGANVYYVLEKDVVLNKAQIEENKSIFVGRDEDGFENIYAAPIANSEDGLGTEIEDEDKPSWMTFGSTNSPKATIGFAIASNELDLSEGKRTVTLTINYSGNDLSNLKDLTNVFDVGLSGEKEIFSPIESPKILSSDNSEFKLEISLGPDEPAIVPFDEKVLEEKLGTKLPVVKILVDKHDVDGKNEVLNLLKDISITSIVLNVKVENITNLLAYNDLSLLNTQKSFVPFGISPVLGSSFYIGSKEAFHKKLQSLKFNIEWEGLPDSFSDHYKAYKHENLEDAVVGLTQSDFRIDIYNLKKGNDGADAIASNQLLFSDISIGSTVSPIDNIIEYDEMLTFGQTSKAGLLKFDLLRDFEHDQYANVLSRQIIAMANLPDNKILSGAYYYKDDGSVIIADSNTAIGDVDSVIMPNEPYTPTVKSITLDYTSEITINSSTQENTVFIHLHPFENTYQQYSSINNTNILPRLHRYSTISESLNVEGALMLGIKDLKPGQSLSILFQVAENTADAETNVAKIRWQYLADNTWKDFKEYEITTDSTEGFLTSGIATFAIPDAINKNNTILSDQLHWIKAWVEKDSAAVSEMINIHTQGLEVSFQDNNNDKDFLNTFLPAETIAKLEKDDASIKSITQEYESFGGRSTEQPLQFYTRVSERLRHKGRAITLYDYERLVLEQFNDIYKVKCINHTNKDNQLAPGHILVAVIPDYTKLKAVDRLEPKVTLAKLEDIRKYLEAKNTTFVGIFDTVDDPYRYLNVVNPEYKKIRVSFEVKFTEDITAVEFYKRELKQAIIRFLSPWAYEDGAELNFGGKVFKSSIQGFVEKQNYVDYIMNFKLMEESTGIDVNYIEADTAHTILVPDDEVFFEIFDAGECIAENTITGDTLGYMKIKEFNTDN